MRVIVRPAIGVISPPSESAGVSAASGASAASAVGAASSSSVPKYRIIFLMEVLKYLFE